MVEQEFAGVRPQALNRDRPDNTQSIVGEEGIPVRQDVDGSQIQRLGIAGADADWGPETVDITDSDEIIANPERVGGTSSSSGLVRSLDDEPCSVVYAWTGDISEVTTIQEAEDDPETVVERPAGVQSDAENIIQNVTTKSDNCVVFVEDNSDEGVANEIEYTLNFH